MVVDNPLSYAVGNEYSRFRKEKQESQSPPETALEFIYRYIKNLHIYSRITTV